MILFLQQVLWALLLVPRFVLILLRGVALMFVVWTGLPIEYIDFADKLSFLPFPRRSSSGELEYDYEYQSPFFLEDGEFSLDEYVSNTTAEKLAQAVSRQAAEKLAWAEHADHFRRANVYFVDQSDSGEEYLDHVENADIVIDPTNGAVLKNRYGATTGSPFTVPAVSCGGTITTTEEFSDREVEEFRKAFDDAACSARTPATYQFGPGQVTLNGVLVGTGTATVDRYPAEYGGEPDAENAYIDALIQENKDQPFFEDSLHCGGADYAVDLPDASDDEDEDDIQADIIALLDGGCGLTIDLLDQIVGGCQDSSREDNLDQGQAEYLHYFEGILDGIASDLAREESLTDHATREAQAMEVHANDVIHVVSSRGQGVLHVPVRITIESTTGIGEQYVTRGIGNSIVGYGRNAHESKYHFFVQYKQGLEA